MTPLNQCLRKVGHASAAPHSLAGLHIREALNELECAYRRPSERIVALEAVLHEFGRIGLPRNAIVDRFLRLSIERRQNKWARQT